MFQRLQALQGWWNKQKQQGDQYRSTLQDTKLPNNNGRLSQQLQYMVPMGSTRSAARLLEKQAADNIMVENFKKEIAAYAKQFEPLPRHVNMMNREAKRYKAFTKIANFNILKNANMGQLRMMRPERRTRTMIEMYRSL